MTDIQNDKKICENDYNIRKKRLKKLHSTLNPQSKRITAKYHQIIDGLDMKDNACQK